MLHFSVNNQHPAAAGEDLPWDPRHSRQFPCVQRCPRPTGEARRGPPPRETSSKTSSANTHLPAEGHDVFPQGLGLSLVRLPPLLHVHALPPLEGLEALALRHVLLWGMAGHAVLGLELVEQGASRTVPLARPLLAGGHLGREEAGDLAGRWSLAAAGGAAALVASPAVGAAGGQIALRPVVLEAVQLGGATGFALLGQGGVLEGALGTGPGGEVRAGGAARGESHRVPHQIDGVTAFLGAASLAFAGTGGVQQGAGAALPVRRTDLHLLLQHAQPLVGQQLLQAGRRGSPGLALRRALLPRCILSHGLGCFGPWHLQLGGHLPAASGHRVVLEPRGEGTEGWYLLSILLHSHWALGGHSITIRDLCRD